MLIVYLLLRLGLGEILTFTNKWATRYMYECFSRSGGMYSQQNDAVITPIARGIVSLSTVLLIDDYKCIRESQCLLTKYETPFIPGVDTVE